MDGAPAAEVAATPAGAAAPPAAALATPDPLELARFGAPPDMDPALIPKFLELARSVPVFVYDEDWGMRVGGEGVSSRSLSR